MYLGHTAINARGDKANPTAFWLAVAAVQDLLMHAAQRPGGYFVYNPLRTKTSKCSYCIGEGIACLRTTRTSRFASGYGDDATACQACIFLDRDCTERHVIVIGDSDEEEEAAPLSTKRRHSSAKIAVETQAKKARQEVKVSLCSTHFSPSGGAMLMYTR